MQATYSLNRHAGPPLPASSPFPCCRRFASIAKLAGEQLGPHIVRIIPRLYRYLYDPNGKVGRVGSWLGGCWGGCWGVWGCFSW